MEEMLYLVQVIPQKLVEKILAKTPHCTGSLGSTAISEAVEKAVSTPNTRYALGSVLNQALLHQSIIGAEAKITNGKKLTNILILL